MCCRYYIEETTEMQAIVSDMMRSSLVRKWNELFPVKTYGEMSPTDIVPVIAPNRNRQRAVFPMKWGFTGKTLLMSELQYFWLELNCPRNGRKRKSWGNAPEM